MAVSEKIDYKKYLSIKEAAFYTGYSTRHLTRLAKRRQIKAKKVLGLWLVEKAALQFLKERRLAHY